MGHGSLPPPALHSPIYTSFRFRYMTGPTGWGKHNVAVGMDTSRGNFLKLGAERERV